MKITQTELDMLLLLDKIINAPDSTLNQKDVGESIFWKWIGFLCTKYNISLNTHYIEKDGEIKKIEVKEKDEQRRI